MSLVRLVFSEFIQECKSAFIKVLNTSSSFKWFRTEIQRAVIMDMKCESCGDFPRPKMLSNMNKDVLPTLTTSYVIQKFVCCFDSCDNCDNKWCWSVQLGSPWDRRPVSRWEGSRWERVAEGRSPEGNLVFPYPARMPPRSDHGESLPSDLRSTSRAVITV